MGSAPTSHCSPAARARFSLCDYLTSLSILSGLCIRRSLKSLSKFGGQCREKGNIYLLVGGAYIRAFCGLDGLVGNFYELSIAKDLLLDRSNS